MNSPQQLRPIPLDEQGTGAANILDGGDYGAGLGLQTTRNTIRVLNGELSDEAFHEKYHGAIVTEFGESARPTEPERSDGRRRTRLDRRWQRRQR